VRSRFPLPASSLGHPRHFTLSGCQPRWRWLLGARTRPQNTRESIWKGMWPCSLDIGDQLSSNLVSAGGDPGATCRTGHIESVVALKIYVVIWTPSLPNRMKKNQRAGRKKGCSAAEMTQAKGICFSLSPSCHLHLHWISSPPMCPCHKTFMAPTKREPQMATRGCRPVTTRPMPTSAACAMQLANPGWGSDLGVLRQADPSLCTHSTTSSPVPDEASTSPPAGSSVAPLPCGQVHV
jgi:hypothetical protein